MSNTLQEFGPEKLGVSVLGAICDRIERSILQSFRAHVPQNEGIYSILYVLAYLQILAVDDDISDPASPGGIRVTLCAI